jgi:hypothetical protein
MFQVIARTDTEVTVIFLEGSPSPGQIRTWTQAEYRQIGVTVTEFIPAEGFTPFIDGSVVPVVAARKAKCHDFAGGWNGYSFYTDSKGGLYAVKNAS